MGRAEQIERRRRRGRSESYEIQPQGQHPVWSVHRVQGSSGRAYDVRLWDLEEPIVHCGCPDFATNALGTCKHVEAVIHHLEKTAPDALEKARHEGSPISTLVYLDATTSPPGIRFRAREGAGEAALGRARELFGEPGILTDARRREGLAAFLSEAEELEIQVAPEAIAHAEQCRAREELAASSARAIEEFGRWRDAVVAKRDRGEEPDSGGEPLAQSVARFSDLADWELDGAAHLLGQARAVLADAAELDKVSQSLAASEFLRLTGRAAQFLVVCPPTRRQHWRRSIRLRTGAEPRILGGTTFEELVRADARSPYCVVPYNRLYRNLDRLKATRFDGLLLDEVQRIKSWPAPTGRAIKSVETSYAFVLVSGRLEMRPQELFYTLQLLDAYQLGPAWQFLDQHVLRDAHGAAVGCQEMDRALEACGPRWLRRTAEEAGNRDACRVVDLYVDLTHHQHHQVDPALRTLLAMTRVKQGWSRSQREELAGLLDKLRRVFTAPELVKPERPGSPKLDELAHLVEDLCRDGHRRVSIFSSDDDVAEVIARYLSRTGVTVVRIDSKTPLRSRKARVTRVAKSEGPVALVISDPAAQDLDLRRVADAMIHAEQPWCPAGLKRRQAQVGAAEPDGCRLELNLLCSDTPEAAVSEAVRRRPEKMQELVPDPDREIDTLLEAEDWQLRELIGLLVDERMVLRPKKALLAGKPVAAAQKPFTLRGLKVRERARRAQPQPNSRYLLGKRSDAKAPDRPGARPGPRRERDPAVAQRAPGNGSRSVPAATVATPYARPNPAAPQARGGPASAAGDVIVIGLETREDRIACQQPSKVHTLGLAMAVTYGFRSGTFTAWRPEFINDLVRTLLSAKLVVGYNPLGFEYKILGPYTGRNLSRIPTVDLMLEITKALGQKVPFDLISSPTLDRAWSGDRSQASSFFQQGRTRELATLCTEGVKVVRDLFVHGVRHGHVYYKTTPAMDRGQLDLGLASRLEPATLKLVMRQG